MEGGREGLTAGLLDTPSARRVARRSSVAVQSAQRDLQARVRLAAQLVDDAIHCRKLQLGASERVMVLQLRHKLQHPAYRVALMAVLLAFLLIIVFEPGSSRDVMAKDGIWFFADRAGVAVVHGVLLALLCGDAALTMAAYGARLRTMSWFKVVVVCLAACVVDFVLALSAVQAFRFSRILRPLLFIAKIRSVRVLLVTSLRALAQLADILVLTVLVFVQAADVASELFSRLQVTGYEAGGDNFDSFSSSLLSLFILSTTENYPSIFYPALDERAVLAALFFGFFLFWTQWLNLPIIMANVFDLYVQEHKAHLRRRAVKRAKALAAAFAVLSNVSANAEKSAQALQQLAASSRMPMDGVGAGVPPSSSGGSLTHARAASRGSIDLGPGFTMVAPDAGGGVDASGGGGDAVAGAASAPAAAAAVVGETASTSTSTSTRSGAAAKRAPRSADSPPARDRGIDFRVFSQLMRTVRRGVTYTDIRCMFTALDTDYSMRVSAAEWLHLPDVLALSFTQLDAMAGEMVAEEDEMAGFRAWARRVVRTRGFRVFQRLCVVLSILPVFFWSVEMQCSFNKCYFAAAGDPAPAMAGGTCTFPRDGPNGWDEAHGSLGGCRDHVLFVTHTISAVAVLGTVAEVALRLAADGLVRFWDSGWARVDLVATVVALGVCVAYVADPGSTLSQLQHASLQDGIGMLRALRYLRVMSVFPRFRAFVATVAEGVVVALRLFVLYFAVTFAFACIGMEMFGDLKGVHAGDQQRWGFQDFASAMLALTQLSITNNWQDVMYPVMQESPMGRWAAWYFVSYFVVCVTLLINILSGIVIEAYSNSKDRLEAQAASIGAGRTRLASIAGAVGGAPAGDVEADVEMRAVPGSDAAGGGGADDDGYVPRTRLSSIRAISRRFSERGVGRVGVRRAGSTRGALWGGDDIESELDKSVFQRARLQAAEVRELEEAVRLTAAGALSASTYVAPAV